MNPGSVLPRLSAIRVGASVLATSLLVVLPAVSLSAADLLRVLPVTADVLMLHFKDGHIDYNGVRPDGTYEPQGENRVYFSRLLDMQAATDAASYRIMSGDDPNYSSAMRPAAMGVKAKGAEFNSPYKTPPYLREYWVYAALPTPLSSGKSYTVQVGDLAENLNRFAFTFDPRWVRSPAIHVSQAGFPPGAPKYAYFSQWMGTLDTPQHPGGALDLSRYADGAFHICDAQSREVRRTYRGLTLQKSRDEKDPSHGNWTRADVYSLDFSDFNQPGRYVVVAEGIGCSHPFEIRPDAYFAAHLAAMRGVFLQRRGIVKDFPEFSREYPRSHHPDINEFVAGKVEGEGKRIDDPRPVEGIWGWYADAGDWDGNPTHYAVPLTLLLTYDLRPQNFRDGDIGNRWKVHPDDSWTEEGGNGLPDLLDEARWWLDFGRRARGELRRQGLGTGGVPRYVGRDAGAHIQPSWADTRVQWVDTGAAETTYAYAAGAAYFAHCLNDLQARSGRTGIHPETAGWLSEARDAFAWAEAQKDPSAQDKRQRQLAAACLYLATGDAGYQAEFKAEWQADNERNNGAWVSPMPNLFASAVYLVSCKDLPNLDRDFYGDVKANIVRRANFGTDNAEQVGFRFAGVEPGQWVGMNLITVPRGMFQAIAYEVTGDRKYLDAMHNSLAYVLGGNPESRTRLSGVGFDREQDVFLCDAWYLLDLNHQAYRNPIFPGASAYAIPMFDVGGPGSEHWARSSTLPDIKDWPLGEQRMRSRYSIAGSEFTVHQNHPWYVFATGYLLSEGARDALRFSRPTVCLNPIVTSSSAASPVRLSVRASADTERVEYYYDWHFAGESTDGANGFALAWDVVQTNLQLGDSATITAIAYDTQGESSLPNPEAEHEFTR
ncbi:MAG: glycoside hydrolase family 9 protein [Pirellulaceae bacterium]|nr:glycoside hydrolase family 9 protein [Pirellulaceae bacterium]